MFSATKGGSPSGYQISRSVRLRSSASAYLNRTFTTPTNAAKWTFNRWVKRGAIGARQSLFAAGTSGSSYANIEFKADDTIQFLSENSAVQFQLVTTQVFRDPSAWYNIHIIYDSANATSTDRIQLWINGVRVTAFSTATYPTTTPNNLFNTAIAHQIGVLGYGSVAYFDGYQTELNFIDGQALTPSSFGETNPVTGVWQPKKYAGTYGTNGFYLNFSDNSAATAAAIGKDNSGNGNNWTPNNISVTAGVTYDSMLDVPTQWADGGNGRGNYAVLNAVAGGAGTYNALANGNLRLSNTTNSGTSGTNISPFVVSSGKWYWEVTATAVPATASNPGVYVGIADASNSLFGQPGGNGPASVGGYAYRSYTGNKISAGGDVAYGATYTANDVIGVALDLTAGTLTFYKNNVSQGTAYTGLTGTYGALGSVFQGGQLDFNFGQQPFAYTPPSGFKALNTLNLPEPTILKGNQYFDATIYTGTGASLNVVNSGGMQPDFVWTKPRSTAVGHTLFDSLRGVTKYLQSNTTGAEGTAATSLTAFNSDGFTVNSDTSTGANGVTYVGWQWKEGATQGFDIVTYTGTGVARTVAHNLGVAPSMMILKSRTGTQSWFVYHQSVGATKGLFLEQTTQAITDSTYWNNTAPTSSVFTLGSGNTNANTFNYVAYLFAEVAGFSKFGSYTGNGSTDGPFVFCGFRPRWIMVKRTDATENWQLYDTSRNTSNVVGEYLLPNSSSAGATITVLDILSNGFKIRVDSTNPGVNASGGTYIYAAFAENPFKNALAR